MKSDRVRAAASPARTARRRAAPVVDGRDAEFQGPIAASLTQQVAAGRLTARSVGELQRMCGNQVVLRALDRAERTSVIQRVRAKNAAESQEEYNKKLEIYKTMLGKGAQYWADLQ